jgi:hypothetical protein
VRWVGVLDHPKASHAWAAHARCLRCVAAGGPSRFGPYQWETPISTPRRPASGRLSVRPTCGCGSRVVELLYCEPCREVFLGGCRAPTGNPNHRHLTPDFSNLEQVPDKAGADRDYRNCAAFFAGCRLHAGIAAMDERQAAPGVAVRRARHARRGVLRRGDARRLSAPPRRAVGIDLTCRHALQQTTVW